MAANFLVAPQWQGSASSRAMRLVDGAEAIRGDLPSSATRVVEIPAEAGEAQDTGIRRFSSLVVIADRMRESLASSTGPVITIGGDCGVEFAAVGHAVARASTIGDDVALVWFDAHPDANSPETSPSGAFSGMVLSAVLGDGVGALSATGAEAIDPGRLLVVGARSADPGERERLEAVGARLVDADDLTDASGVDALVAAVESTGASAVYIHVDLDVLDPGAVSGVGEPVPFGVDPAIAVAAITALRARFAFVGGGITGFAPSSPAAAVDDLPTILRLVGALTR